MFIAILVTEHSTSFWLFGLIKTKTEYIFKKIWHLSEKVGE